MTAPTDFDLYLFGQGTHRRAYDFLGAHPGYERGVAGVRFAVWAPDAEAVSVVGNWNGWQPGATLLQPVGHSGIWAGFVPDLRLGTLYKYAIKPRFSFSWIEKVDPYAFRTELRPNTASVVADLDAYTWHDAEWMANRGAANGPASPISIYEVHLGSWRRDPADPERFLTYRELADQLPPYVRELGFSHIELLPVAEHPLDMSWGYQVTGYFAPTARFGSPLDFMHLVDVCHQAGIGVILDWVPAHFPRDIWALARFDGTALYEHADPRQGEHQDWGTLIFNFGRHEVQDFLISNALFWLDKYHIDGLRVDAVASMLYLDYSRQEGQWVPNRYGGRENLEAISLLQNVNRAVHEEFPTAITAAEESTAWPGVTQPVSEGGLGFDFKWNMGWMHDTLRYLQYDPIYRKYHQNELTFSLVYAFSERFILPLSHDEVVHLKGSLLNKMPGDMWQKFANLRLLYTYMWAHPGKKLLFMGGEFGQWAEWNYATSLDWHLLDGPPEFAHFHWGLQDLVSELNGIYREYPAMHEQEATWQGFQWIDFSDAENSVIAFQRLAVNGEFLVVVCNFTPVVRHDYRIGLPVAGGYREIFNSDAEKFGGSGVTQGELITAEEETWHGNPYSATFTLPPLAAFILRPESQTFENKGS